MQKAILIIDVTDFYLDELFRDGEYLGDVDQFIRNIVHRIAQIQEETVLLFTDSQNAKFPEEFWGITEKYGPAFYKEDFSAFNNPIQESDLHRLLQKHNVEELEICGLYENWCIAATIQDALELGYDVVLNPFTILHEDGTIGQNLEYWEKKDYHVTII